MPGFLLKDGTRARVLQRLGRRLWKDQKLYNYKRKVHLQRLGRLQKKKLKPERLDCRLKTLKIVTGVDYVTIKQFMEGIEHQLDKSNSRFVVVVSKIQIFLLVETLKEISKGFRVDIFRHLPQQEPVLVLEKHIFMYCKEKLS